MAKKEEQRLQLRLSRHPDELRWDLQVPAYGFYYLEQILTY